MISTIYRAVEICDERKILGEVKIYLKQTKHVAELGNKCIASAVGTLHMISVRRVHESIEYSDSD